jgi:acetyltransferase-like isoleucine patch superfamily enzyme
MFRIIKEVLKQLIRPFRDLIRNMFKHSKLLIKYKTLNLKGIVFIRNSTFGKNNLVHASMIQNCAIGDYTYISKNTYLKNCVIGKYCCIAPNVAIGYGEHPTNTFVSVHPVFYANTNFLGYTFGKENYFEEHHKTTIGNDVWVGANVIIKGGVKIGNGAIVAAGAVVTKDVADYTIVGGVPAKLIKARFEQDEISFLQDYKWWDKDFDFLRKNYLLFHDIKNFIKINSSIYKNSED